MDDVADHAADEWMDLNHSRQMDGLDAWMGKDP